ncbi:MAG TPA: hypothetical protein VD836_13335 [Solirubrobacteraceae bacterium]|nr:hypothetical protein [Solirubrobacteraceae bacterium]
MRSPVPFLAAVLILLLGASAAHAAPPPNDSRAAAQALTIPANVEGTTVEATLDEDEPPGCAFGDASVWYSFGVGAPRQILVALDAAGDLDATIEVFERARSQVTSLGCQNTNRRGEATLDIDARADTPYLIRVSPLANSVRDAFRLRVVAPDEPARAPGQRLPAGGTSGELDRFANGDDAWAVRMTAGRSYRINLVSRGGSCVRGELYPASDFPQNVVKRMACDDHVVYTPPRSGTYTVLVRATRGTRERVVYRLRAGLAGRDDSAPGATLADDRRVRGALAGNELDALDLYRFTIARRADLRLRLQTGADFELRLISATGRRIGSDGGSGELVRRVRPGRYFVAIRALDGAAGGYTLSRLARTITSARMTVDGGRRRTLSPGETADLSLRVTPAVTGRATLVVERYDPIEGWLFHRTYHVRVAGEAASVAFTPPFVGRWRVSGAYDGTRNSSPSSGGTARFDVLEPLE